MTDYNLGPVKPWVAAAADQLGTFFGIDTIGGYRASATDPNGHPAGRALDLMTPSKLVGDRLAAYAQMHHRRLGVEYIIWRQQIWSVARSNEGWRAMEDRGSPTANHMDHVHLNFTATAPAGGKSVPEAPQLHPVAGGTYTGTAGNTASAGAESGSNATPVGASSGGSVRDQLLKVVIVAGVCGTGVALIAAGAARATKPARQAGADAAGDTLSVASLAVPQLRAAGAAGQLAKGTRA